ncbi:MAG: hypothetical protein IMZ66_11890 [Planctomycetes bacterium]|nr:hypothetical protein [Planctomycetota bacterium]
MYDAWNRLVAVYRDSNGNGAKDAGDTLLHEAQYDGLRRRIAKIVRKVQGETVAYDRTDYYYAESWQCLEERTSEFAALDGAGGARTTAAADVKVQYVWDLRYIDAPVLRWRDTGGGAVSSCG